LTFHVGGRYRLLVSDVRSVPVPCTAWEKPMNISPVTAMITCPACGGEATEPMPTDACRYLYTCGHCGVTLRPRPGDCCVFCSYGNVSCPPKQAERGAWS